MRALLPEKNVNMRSGWSAMFDLIRKRCEEGRLYLVINRERVLLEEMNLIRMDAKLPIPTKGNNPVCNL